MKIEKALKLKIGDTVYYPPDRGDPGGYSKITFIGSKTIYKNIYGHEYIRVNLACGGVWPTNRLG